LPNDARVVNFVNADLIAAGLSPLRPELAAVAAARFVLEQIARLTEMRANFAWESTLSGLTYVKRIRAPYTALWRMPGRYTTIRADQRN
jgi:predicted ABC-type ATPase